MNGKPIYYEWVYDGNVVRVFMARKQGWNFHITCLGDDPIAMPDEHPPFVTWQSARQNAHLTYASLMGRTLTRNKGVGRL